MPFFLIACTAVTAAALICLIESFFFYDVSLNAASCRATHAAQPPLEYERDLTWLKRDCVQDVAVRSFDGLLLHAVCVQNTGRRWAILCHGYTSAGQKMAYQAQRFFEIGYSVLCPDARGHGQSEGRYIGMGWHDRLDVKRWIRYILERQPDAQIVLYGISMGGATVLMTAGEPLPKNVCAIVEDCGYTSVRDEFKHVLNRYVHLPAFPMLHAAALQAKMRSGYNFLLEGDAIKQVEKSVTPILFIHGRQDTFVPYEMSERLRSAARRCRSQTLTVDDAGHAECCVKAPELYWSTISEFLQKYVRSS